MARAKDLPKILPRWRRRERGSRHPPAPHTATAGCPARHPPPKCERASYVGDGRDAFSRPGLFAGIYSCGNFDGETRAGGQVVFYSYVRIVLGENVVGDGEAEPRAAALGRKIRKE